TTAPRRPACASATTGSPCGSSPPIPNSQRIPNRRRLPMSIQSKAVVCRELNAPVVVETITVQKPQAGAVLVEMRACGVCHSVLSATNGTVAFPLPLVLGHEGAGIVVEVGGGVTERAPGDHVLTSSV